MNGTTGYRAETHRLSMQRIACVRGNHQIPTVTDKFYGCCGRRIVWVKC